MKVVQLERKKRHPDLADKSRDQSTPRPPTASSEKLRQPRSHPEGRGADREKVVDRSVGMCVPFEFEPGS